MLIWTTDCLSINFTYDSVMRRLGGRSNLVKCALGFIRTLNALYKQPLSFEGKSVDKLVAVGDFIDAGGSEALMSSTVS